MSELTNLQLSEGTAGPGSLSIAARDQLRAQILALRNNRLAGPTGTVFLGMTQQAGRLRSAYIITDQAFSAGESVTIDIRGADGGGSYLVAPVSVSLAMAKEIQLNLPIAPGLVDVDAGTAFDVVRTYTAGGSPANPHTLVVLEYA